MVGLCANRRCTSVPSLGNLAAYGSGVQLLEVLGPQEPKGSQACFSPVFDLELDAKLRASSSNLDRCWSHQHLHQQPSPGSSLLQQILTLCRCSSPVQAQLLQQLQRLRSAAYAASPAQQASSSAISGHSSDGHAAVVAPEAPLDVSCAGGADEQPRLDVEAMACELLALGYMVQVRDGGGPQQVRDGGGPQQVRDGGGPQQVRDGGGPQQPERSKSARSCLQSLRHRYIVCLGVCSAADGDPWYLPEPLVVEPRLREQFTIAHPTPDYEALLQSVPPCFVGPIGSLEAVVKLICEQMTTTFKLQGLPVPPWRTRTALLSKWSPGQLAELAAKIASLRRLVSGMPLPATRGLAPCQSHEQLLNDDRPAAAHANHAAVGSAPGAGHGGYARVAQAAGHAGAGVHSRLPCFVDPVAGDDQAEPRIGAAVLTSMAARGGAAVAGEQQAAAADGVRDMHAFGDACNGGLAPAPAALHFARNASAEWKHQRSSSRKIKGLLAAALQTSRGGSRSNLLAGTGAPLAAAEPGASQATGPVGNHNSAAAEGHVQCAPVHPGNDALIRRTHFRAGCDEPWRHITTVRLGGLPGPQQH